MSSKVVAMESLLSVTVLDVVVVVGSAAKLIVVYADTVFDPRIII